MKQVTRTETLALVAQTAFQHASQTHESKATKCACRAKKRYEEQWKTANNQKTMRANQVAYSRAKHMLCVVNGVDSHDCTIPDMPKLKRAKFPAAVQQAKCHNLKHEEVKPALPPKLKKVMKSCEAGAGGNSNTAVRGSVVDLEGGKGLSGVSVHFIDAESGRHIGGSEVTDSNGMFKIKLPGHRCKFFSIEYRKKGYVTSKCPGNPMILWKAEELVTEGMTRHLRANQVKVSFGWANDAKYRKDLDLHVMIPGRRKIQHTEYKGIDVAESKDPKDDLHHIYWASKGDKSRYPFTQYDLDHGSMSDGESLSGGPEAVHIAKVIPGVTYGVWADCWSCDEKETAGGDVEFPLTATALRDFRASRANVKIYQGKSLLACVSITDAKGKPTTRWDAALIRCAGGNQKCNVMTESRYNPKYPTVPLRLLRL